MVKRSLIDDGGGMRDEGLFCEAKKYMPGGVNSPVRSFKAVGGEPVFMKKGKGSKIFSDDGREFIDFCLSWGALILGHAHPDVTGELLQAVREGTSFGTSTKLEVELAKLVVDAVPSIEKLRLTNSGTEAVMSAIRLARAYAGKDKIIKFEGAYHGHADYLLAKAGSGIAALGMPDSLGVPKDFTKHTIVLPFNNIEEVEKAVSKREKEIAAIIVEPVMANCGIIMPQPNFLKGLRRIADRFGLVLIFDEVITGFRLSYGGAQQYFNITPDLTCLGKIVGGGLPLAAFGGKTEIMDLIAPSGGVYQAGTLAGNPIAVTAGIAALKALRRSDPYEELDRKTKCLSEGIELMAKEKKIKLKVNRAGSMFSIFFSDTDKEITDYEAARAQDTDLFKQFFHNLLEKGAYISPSSFEANFLSTTHSEEDINNTLSSISKSL